ncbi:MAG: T9SS type A sorting domain-containing protein, partial [Ignavibacteria bacterium]|nr:T9SS type A sorting domain-containing protein [Ignavibacteria bacterium]
IPQYIQGINGTNNNRLPFAFWLNIGNLQANTTYRFINQAVVATDTPTTSGAGNVIYVNTTGDFTRTSSASFSDPGGYGTLVTDVTGSYSGWFITEATGNVRFTPGNEIFFRLRLNDGNEGTVAVTYLTTTNFAKVIDFGNTTAATEGTGLRVISGDSPKSFAVLYDNTAGTGRPIYATSIEATGIDYTAVTSYAPFYRDFVSGVNGSWGGILPNMNANGIKNMNIVNPVTSETKTYTSNDGMWGTVDTRNPSGGLTEVLVIDLILIGVNEPIATIGKAFATQNDLNITLVNDQRTQIEIVNLLGQSMMQTILEGSNNYVITHQFKSGAYLLRISNEQGSLSQKFIIR